MKVMHRARRSWRLVAALSAVALAGGTALLLTVGPASAHDSHVDGSYLLNAVAGDGTTFTVVAGFASNGVLTNVLSDDPATEVGSWRQTGRNDVVATVYAFEVAPATPTSGPVTEGTVKVVINGELDGGTLSGTYDASGTTPSGGDLFPPDHGTFSGERIRPGS